MIYTRLTKRAMKLCFEAHKNQLDLGGMPYAFHPFHVAEQMEDEYSAAAALLHDVAEDTEITVEDIERMGFPPAVTDALRLLRHDKSIPYLDYIRALASNPIARAVKRADLIHNSDLSRLDTVDARALRRVEKYRRALEILDEAE